MSDSTEISWTDATWSPVTGCTRTSEGCLHCYIDRTPPFRMNGRKFDGPDIGATTGVKLHSDRLGVPMKWRKPRRVFVCSLADLFQDEVPDRFIADVFAVMALSPQHTFQVLTKRHARMRSLLKSDDFKALVAVAMDVRTSIGGIVQWPLPHVWVGVSVENQKWADIRIPALLDTPAAVRWISAEPLLGPVDLHAKDDGLNHWLPDFGPQYDDGTGAPVCQAHGLSQCRQGCAFIDWVVVGGESGPGARPMHPQWARDLRDQCAEAGVAYHFKQHGQYAPVTDRPQDGDRWLAIDGADTNWQHGDGHVRQGGGDFRWPGSNTVLVRRARSKHDAGRVLDGRTWDEYPADRQAVTA